MQLCHLVNMSVHCLFQGMHVCLQDKLQSWSTPFRDAFGGQPGVHWFELSLVESAVRA